MKPNSVSCDELSGDSIALGGGAASVVVPPGSYLIKCTDGICAGFQACPAGWVGKEELTQECTPCEKGRSSFEGTTDCRTCTKGKFAREEKSKDCKSCPAGWYQPQETKPTTSCIDCPAGWGAIVDGNDQEVSGSALCLDLVSFIFVGL